MKQLNNISLIAAVGKNFELGYQNQLLCHLPVDLKHFKTLTLHHTVVMGRKTWESLPVKPLPERRNIVLSRQDNLKLDKAEVFHSFNEIITTTVHEKELFIIGGASIYQLFFPLANKIYLTLIDSTFHADVYFPKIKIDEWQLIEEFQLFQNENQQYNLSFQTYKRK